MGDWASPYIQKLQAGETVQFRPRGYSMRGRVENKSLCTVAPLSGPPSEGDVVLCRVNGNSYLHLVKAVKTERGKLRYLIGNNVGHDNGWIGLNGIYGVLIRNER